VITYLGKIVEELDFRLVMVTNQDGLGTRSFPEETFWPAHNKMVALLEGEGIAFDEVIIDRTFKRENKPTRKPGTALLTEYMQGDFDLENSYVIGDRLSDILLAYNLGAKGIMIGKSLDLQDDEVDKAHVEAALALSTVDWKGIYQFLTRSNSSSVVSRTTLETSVNIFLDLYGEGKTTVKTGIGFFDHMLEQLGKHANLNLSIETTGDLHIDEHHTIEDTALALGAAFKKALGEKRGISRYGHFSLVMDEALAEVALDFSGRPYMTFEGKFNREKVGGFPTEMVQHFFKSFADTSGTSLYIKVTGENDHHQIEAIFKSFARAIKMALTRTGGNELPSTKGVL
ncbi:MAG: bifunctional histidinol-phosphatase/imidazoleglycerol-phosphate dehydratase HisB, partial [Bacteroidota bacterium]